MTDGGEDYETAFARFRTQHSEQISSAEQRGRAESAVRIQELETLLREEQAENARLKEELRQVCELNSEAREFIKHLPSGGRV